MEVIKRLYTDSEGKPCSAKMQNSAVFFLIFIKLAVSGATLFGHEFSAVTLESMGPYLALMGVTTGGYLKRASDKGKGSAA